MKTKGKKRRKFLSFITKAIATFTGGYFLWIIKNYLFYNPSSASVNIGKFSDYIIGKVVHIKEQRIFCIRDNNGLYVLSDTCTHKNCMLGVEKNTLACPCHDGVFSIEGLPIEGCVEIPLDHYYIHRDKDGYIVVNVSKIVSMNFRYRE